MATTTLARINKQMPQKKITSAIARNYISNTLTGKKADDFVTSLISLVNQNPELEKCDHVSLVASALQAQFLNLNLHKSLGHAWIIPFNDNKTNRMLASFQIGYKGYIQLAIRSGQYKKLNCICIKEGELKYFDPLNEDLDVELIQDEEEREKANTIGYYAMFEYLNGFRKALYWSKEKMLAHAKKYSKAFYNDFRYNKSSSFWSRDFDAMACKTMLRQIISKWGIMSADLISAYETDMKAATNINEFADVIDYEASESPEFNETMDVETVEHQESEVSEEVVRDEGQEADKKRTKKAPEAKMEAMQPQTMLEEREFSCPKPNRDGSPRTVTDEDCFYCKDKEGCPAHEKPE